MSLFSFPHMRQRLVQFIGIGFLAIFLPLGLFAQDGLVSPNRLVIQGGTLISGTGEAPVPNAVIVIEGKRITAVGAAGSVSIPSAAEIIQADGKFILPGFADMHVHWQHWMPELFLAHGVTSAVDLESGEWTLAQRDLIRDGRRRPLPCSSRPKPLASRSETRRSSRPSLAPLRISDW